jgi:hypothetical protein
MVNMNGSDQTTWMTEMSPYMVCFIPLRWYKGDDDNNNNNSNNNNNNNNRNNTRTTLNRFFKKLPY